MCSTGVSDLAAGMRSADGVCQLSNRWQPMLDDWFIEQMEGVELRLNHPTAREVAIVFDEPWEGNTSGYVTVLQDEETYRMYYRGSRHSPRAKEACAEFACYAQSGDGIHWEKPELGLVEFEGSARNNIIWAGPGSHNFVPFKDSRPGCPAAERYKAMGVMRGKGLVAFRSADGIHWELIQREPIITEGAFDSQNLAFWDGERGRYVAFFRDSRDGVRDIKTCTSEDFLHWSRPRWLDYGDAPRQHLYTNAILPYVLAPQVFVGFPMRFLPERNRLSHPCNGVSDGVFMSSRDGVHWRRWPEAFIRPGPQRERWVCRNNMVAWGILLLRPDVPGTPRELSLYCSENYYAEEGAARMRRHTIRADGFVSVHAPFRGGELLTRPLTFDGRELVINYATSAAGSVRVEIADKEGVPLPGFSLEQCTELYGDDIEEAVRWESGGDLSGLGGTVVRLRFALQDADLYAIGFRS